MEQKLRLALYLKMFVGFVISFVIAKAFNLPYSYTAGVIAVLNLWYSRDNVYKAALTRLISSVVGLSISALLFFLFGYHIYILVIMVLLVLTSLYLLKIEYGATIALVLIGQQWSEQTSIAPLNALLIMVIGTLPALILNFFTYRKSTLLEKQKALLDHQIESIFVALSRDTTPDFPLIDETLATTNNAVKTALDNYKIDNMLAILAYTNMRQAQVTILKKISETLLSLSSSEYKAKITDYLGHFEGHIGVNNYAEKLLEELEELLNYYRGLMLPKTRPEFEHRATLFGIIDNIRQVLMLKIEFHEQYPTI